jgi:hypothetical protein
VRTSLIFPSFDGSGPDKDNVKEGIVVTIDISRNFVIDCEVVRKPKPTGCHDNYVESKTRMEIAAEM